MSVAEAPPRAPLTDRSARLVLAWVGLYTRGVATKAAHDRRAEIEADLWEEAMTSLAHGPPGSLAPQRLSRLVRGMPADLAWRFEHRAGRIAEREIVMRPSIGEWLLIAVAASMCLWAVIAAGSLVLNPNPENWSSWGPVGLTVAGSLGLLGLALVIGRPAVGFGVLVIAAVLGGLAMPWAFYGPAFLALVGGIRWYRTRRPGVAAA